MHKLRFFLALLLFSLLPSLSWGRCYTEDFIRELGIDCKPHSCVGGSDLFPTYSYCQPRGSACAVDYKLSSSDYLYLVGTISRSGDGSSLCNLNRDFCKGYAVHCTTQAEADSVACIQAGNTWQNGACKTTSPMEECQEKGDYWNNELNKCEEVVCKPNDIQIRTECHDELGNYLTCIGNNCNTYEGVETHYYSVEPFQCNSHGTEVSALPPYETSTFSGTCANTNSDKQWDEVASSLGECQDKNYGGERYAVFTYNGVVVGQFLNKSCSDFGRSGSKDTHAKPDTSNGAGNGGNGCSVGSPTCGDWSQRAQYGDNVYVMDGNGNTAVCATKDGLIDWTTCDWDLSKNPNSSASGEGGNSSASGENVDLSGIESKLDVIAGAVTSIDIMFGNYATEVPPKLDAIESNTAATASNVAKVETAVTSAGSAVVSAVNSASSTISTSVTNAGRDISTNVGNAISNATASINSEIHAQTDSVMRGIASVGGGSSLWDIVNGIERNKIFIDSSIGAASASQVVSLEKIGQNIRGADSSAAVRDSVAISHTASIDTALQNTYNEIYNFTLWQKEIFPNVLDSLMMKNKDTSSIIVDVQLPQEQPRQDTIKADSMNVPDLRQIFRDSVANMVDSAMDEMQSRSVRSVVDSLANGRLVSFDSLFGSKGEKLADSVKNRMAQVDSIVKPFRNAIDKLPSNLAAQCPASITDSVRVCFNKKKTICAPIRMSLCSISLWGHNVFWWGRTILGFIVAVWCWWVLYRKLLGLRQTFEG